MSGSIRKILVVTALVFAALVPISFAFLMINNANHQQITTELDTRGNANSHANQANIAKERTCRPLPPPAVEDCEARIDEATREAQHDEYDLEAQKTTAIWTRYMGFAAILGTAFGILGVALVLLTFMGQRRTSRAELRAYVFPDRVLINDGSAKGLRFELANVPSVQVVLKNFGSTPARNVRHSGGLVLTLCDSTDDPPYHPQLKHFAGQALPPTGEHTHYLLLTVSPLDPPPVGMFCLTPPQVEAIREGVIGLLCYGKITYEDVFGEERTTEYRFIQTNHWPPDGGQTGMRYAGRGNQDD